MAEGKHWIWTREQAREMAGKALQARLRQKQDRLEQAKVDTVRPFLITSLHPVLVMRARKIEGLIRKTETAYLKADLPKDLASLAQALDKLIHSWCILTGHEQPAMRKPAQTNPMSMVNIPMPEPMDEPNHTILQGNPDPGTLPSLEVEPPQS